MNRPVGHQRMHTKRRAIAHASCVGSIVSIICPRIICARLSNHWVENRAVFYFPSCIASVVMNFAVFMQHSTKPMRNANNSIRPNSSAGLCWMDFSIVNRFSWDVEKRINGFVDAVQSTLLKWIALEPHRQHPLRQTIHLSVLYIWHCV